MERVYILIFLGGFPKVLGVKTVMWQHARMQGMDDRMGSVKPLIRDTVRDQGDKMEDCCICCRDRQQGQQGREKKAWAVLFGLRLES